MSVFRRRMMMMSKADYLRFTAEEDGSTLQLTQVGSPDAIEMQYRINGGLWQNYAIGDTITLANVGDNVEMYGGNDHFSKSEDDYYKFVMSGKIAASGNVMSVFGFSDSCASYCYRSMFNGCTSLVSAPQLPATTLAKSCYYAMFTGCTSLVSAPQLPSTTLAESCYYAMFYGCTSLVSAPQLPATTLAKSCYQSMFGACGNLERIDVNFSTWGTNNETYYWVNGVKSTGTFIRPSSLPNTQGLSYIPYGWLIVSK